MKLILTLTTINVYILMVAGNIVTTTGSGLDCPDWPLCYGSVAPPMEVGIWIEWSHRLLGGLAGMFLLLTNLVIWKYGEKITRRLSLAALGLIGVGAIFGGIIVLIEAPKLTEFLHIAVISFHIIIATIIFTLLIMAYRTLRDPYEEKPSKIYLLLFGVVIVQVLIGIYVRYGQASLACPDFPLCRGELFPDLVDSKVMYHFFHRVTAITIFLIASWKLYVAVKEEDDILYSAITMGLVLAQGALGAYIVWTGMFLPFIVLHGANGFLLLGWLAYRSAPLIIPRA